MRKNNNPNRLTCFGTNSGRILTRTLENYEGVNVYLCMFLFRHSLNIFLYFFEVKLNKPLKIVSDTDDPVR